SASPPSDTITPLRTAEPPGRRPGTDVTPAAPPARWQGAAAAGLPPLPQTPSMQVAPADLAAHGPVRAAIDAYNERPNAVNLAAVRKAFAEAPALILKERREKYQTDVESYKLAVGQRESARKAQQIPDYGLGSSDR